jgi:phage terminase large subunit-like protein
MATSRLLGKEPMPWQAEVFEVAFELDAFGLLWYREIVIVIPRQSGKSTLVIPWGVHRMTTWGERQFMLYTAQTRGAAKQKLVDEQFFMINQSPFRRLLIPNRQGRILPNLSHGEERLEWANGSKWLIDAPTETAAHGLTLGLGVGDEFFSHADARVEAAMSPTMITVPDSQKLWLSTVGKTKKKSPFMWSKMEAGRNRVESALELRKLGAPDSRTLYIEFSFPEDADFLDRLVWWQNMPALGYTISEAGVAAQLDSIGEIEFRRAFGNQWADDRPDDWKIPADDWYEIEDEDSEITDTLTWVIDVSPERTFASIGLASQRDDGQIHIEVIEHSTGTGWLIDGDPTRELRGIAALIREHGGELYYDHMTVGALVPDLIDAGLEPQPIPLADIKVSAAALFDAVKNRKVVHLGQFELTDALAAAATRKIGDAWAWARGPSMADITALVAVTLAFWMLAKTLPDLNYDPLAAMREGAGRSEQ